jgi:nicotinamide phosphoribosyltransferase
MKINPLLLTDGYKTGHHLQYPKGTTLVYSNFTPRANKYAPNGARHIVSFGQQMVVQQIHDAFQEGFFNRTKSDVISEIQKELSLYLGTNYDVSHFENLHDLGHLPIFIKAISEGVLVPIKVPVLTIRNTHPEFYWVTNYLETIISNLLWKPMTSATIAFEYRKLLHHWLKKTDDRDWMIDWQAHDFSMRGMDSAEAVMSSGLGHATSFKGSDSLPVIAAAREFYPDPSSSDMIVGSVNATEHSVMCSGGEMDEVGTFRRLLEVYPTGILSIVSDTWDLWRVLTRHVVELKENILARDGKLVIRPDSGNPADILCGYNSLDDYDLKERQVSVDPSHPSTKGVVELLWDTFGGTINSKGYKVLNEKVGAIYGDAITIARADEICRRLALKGFATGNVVLGVGSFTYQFNTRDTFGFAMKATYVEVAGVGRAISKNPATDSGVKKSATGLLQVRRENGQLVLEDNVGWDRESTGELLPLYENGNFLRRTSLGEVRRKIEQMCHG